MSQNSMKGRSIAPYCVNSKILLFFKVDKEFTYRIDRWTGRWKLVGPAQSNISGPSLLVDYAGRWPPSKKMVIVTLVENFLFQDKRKSVYKRSVEEKGNLLKFPPHWLKYKVPSEGKSSWLTY